MLSVVLPPVLVVISWGLGFGATTICTDATPRTSGCAQINHVATRIMLIEVALLLVALCARPWRPDRPWSCRLVVAAELAVFVFAAALLQ